jgi:hypothetical protein
MGICIGPNETEQAPSYLARLEKHKAHSEHQARLALALADNRRRYDRKCESARFAGASIEAFVEYEVRKSRLMGGRA